MVLAPPDDLPGPALTGALERWWGMAVASMRYRAVGWGSHHWEVTGAAGRRWFVTADELHYKRLSESEPLAEGMRRLRAALAAATDLRDCGRPFVVAPVPARDGEPVVRLGRFALAVYPFVAGQSFHWGEFSSPAHRLSVLDLVVAVHTAPAAAGARALGDDFTVPYRDELAAARGPAGPEGPGPRGTGPHETGPHGDGPYARPVAQLVREHAAPIQRLLARYDELVRMARSEPSRAVLTHGEPHPGNTMLTAGGWVLIDWDTALTAPPERDLWSLDPGDGSILAAYASATGVIPRPAMLDLYRLRWDIADIAIDVSRLRRARSESPDDAKSWGLLSALVRRVSSPDYPGGR